MLLLPAARHGKYNLPTSKRLFRPLRRLLFIFWFNSLGDTVADIGLLSQRHRNIVTQLNIFTLQNGSREIGRTAVAAGAKPLRRSARRYACGAAIKKHIMSRINCRSRGCELHWSIR